MMEHPYANRSGRWQGWSSNTVTLHSEPSLTPPDYDSPGCPECKSNNVSDGVCYDCGYVAPEPDIDDGTLWDMSRDFT